MKKQFPFLLMCLMGLIPFTTFSQTKLAEWNFDTEYTTAINNDTTFYTPTSTALTADPNITTSGNFAVYADSAILNQSASLFTSSTTYTQLISGYNNYVCRLMYQGPNAIADFTDATNHNHYFQFAFPTSGYDNIVLNFAFSSGQNDPEDFLELVFSTDGGNNWVDVGKYNPANGWWIYDAHSASISAKNKENVLVRLISSTTSTNGTANFNMDYFNVTGTVYSSGQTVDETTDITWPFDLGTEGQVATYSGNTAGFFKPDHVAVGSNLAYVDKTTTFGITYTRFQPAEQLSNPNETCIIGFNIWPKTGLNFIPTAISFDCVRYGTDGGLFDVIWKSSDGTSTVVGTGVRPNRNNDASGAGTHASLDLSGVSIPASTAECTLELYLYALGNNKQVGLANVVLSGTVNGTIVDIPIYKISTPVSPAGAGSIKTLPVGNEFDEGTEVSITASRNFGFEFSKWVDENGTELSTDNPFTFILDADKTVSAVFNELVTYQLDWSILGSQWGEISLSPEPNDGKYEAGTIVSAVIVANPVTSFNYWDDNGTQMERTVVMDKDQTITATFDEIPFIVGWDFRTPDPKVSRPGDFFSETINTGTLSAHKADGTSVGWLANLPSFSPAYPNARIWASDFVNDRRYFMASFSTTNYTNIQITSMMTANYQAHSIQKLEYSLNGTDFTTLNTIDITTNYNGTWTELNAALPELAENSEKVYIRWIADTSSPTLGDGNDGTALTNVFVFADKTAVNDTEKPVLLASVPANGSSSASSTGSISLTFNEKMIAAGNCTLNGQVLTPILGAKTVKFNYEKLSYDTEYILEVPAGALTDISGNTFDGTTLNFNTMSRPQPIAKLYNAVLATDGSGDYTTLQDAIDAAPSNRVIPWLIFIKKGKYTGHVNIPTSKSFIHLIGQERKSVIISDDRLAGEDGDPNTPVYHVSEAATIVVNASDCYFENITFQNGFGYENQSGPQSLAMYTNNDRITFKNCTMRSYQDTYLTSTKGVTDRHYLVDCRIEGAVDYIYGGGDVFFDECTIYNTRPSGGYIVAPNHGAATLWGYVFSNCVIDGNPGVITYYGRPWHESPKTVFINPVLKCDVYSVGWYYKMGAIPAIFADYGTMDENGNLVDLSNRISDYEYDVKDADANVTETVKGTAKNSLTDEEAATYTYENVLLRSGDSWDPKVLTEATTNPFGLSLNKNVLSWNVTPYAMCYVITRNDTVVAFTIDAYYTDKSMQEGGKYIYKVQAASGYGALSEFSEELNSTTVPVKNTAINTPINAFGKQLAVQLTGLIGPSLVCIYSINGQLIHQKITRQTTAELTVPKGFYVVTVSSNKEVNSFKVSVNE